MPQKKRQLHQQKWATGEGELVGDKQHELGPHELEGTPRGGGDSGAVPTGVAGVAQGAAEEEPHCGGGGGDGHEEQEEEPGPVVG